MKARRFERKVEALERRVEELRRRVAGSPEEVARVLPAALDELLTALEELAVAEGGLRQQNEELAASRQLLEDEHRRYVDLFDFAPDGYVVTDPAGVIREVNRAAAGMLGVSCRLLTGKPLMAFVVRDEHKAFRRQLQRLRNRTLKKALDWQVTLKPRGGKPMPAAMTVAHVRDRGNRLVGLRWLLRDISDRLATEAERERLFDEVGALSAESRRQADESETRQRLLESLMEQVSVGITIADAPNVNIRMVSRYGQELTGRRAEDLEGLPAEEHPEKWRVFRPDGVTLAKPEELPLTRATQYGETVRDEEWVIERPDGAKVPVLCNAGPIYDAQGAITGGVVAWVDITERKQAEQGLRLAMGQMQDRAAETEALLTASRAILEHHEFKDAARAVYDACKCLLGAQAGYVALLGEDGVRNEMLFLDAGGLECKVDPSLPMPVRGLREQAYSSGKTVYENDFASSLWVQFMPPGHAPLENVLFAPLAIRGKAVGLLGLANKPGGFTENDARLATAFGELAAIALANSRAEEALRKARDELEVRVRERTNDLEQANIALQDEVQFRKRTEQQLEDERKRLFSVLNMLPGFVMLIHRDRTIAFANQTFRNVFGDLAGRRCYDILHGRQVPCGACRAEEILESGSPREWDWTDQQGRKYHSWGYPFADADGTPLVLEVGLDMTERRELEKEVLEISAQERHRIGRDLHDVLGQNLTGISFLSKVLSQRLTAAKAPQAAEAAEIAQLVSTAVSQARVISRGLCPVEPGEGGLCHALEELVAGTESVFGLPCSLKCDPAAAAISDGNVAASLYHIASEAVNNAVKHARAKHLWIHLAQAEGRLRLSVRDDGVGLPEDQTLSQGMGLRIMRYRADLIGAALAVEHDPAGGTRVVCSLPQASM